MVPPDLRVTARQQIAAADERARALAEQSGYLAVRRSWRMRDRTMLWRCCGDPGHRVEWWVELG
jgi:hypothetical protein